MIKLFLVDAKQTGMNFFLIQTKSLGEETIVVRKLEKKVMRKDKCTLRPKRFACGCPFEPFFLIDVGLPDTTDALSAGK